MIPFMLEKVKALRLAFRKSKGSKGGGLSIIVSDVRSKEGFSDNVQFIHLSENDTFS